MHHIYCINKMYDIEYNKWGGEEGSDKSYKQA